MVVYRGCHVLLMSLCQPHSLMFGISCWTEVAWLQYKLACCSARFTCWNSAAWVGGIFSNDLPPVVKRRILASLTRSAPHPFLYISTTKDSIHCICSELRLNRSGLYVRASSVSVSSGMLLQAAHAVFLPHPRNCEVVSHYVSLWKRGSAKDFNGPILERMVCIGMPR